MDSQLASRSQSISEFRESFVQANNQPEEISAAHKFSNEAFSLSAGDSSADDKNGVIRVTTPANTMDRCTVTSRIVSLTHKYDVACKSGNDGIITEKFLSLTRSFYFDDKQGNNIANARARYFSWGNTIDVTDEKGNALGTIKENIFQSLFKPYTVYTIYDPSGKEIASSRKVEWLGTQFSIYDKSGKAVAQLNRPWINFLRDTWTADIDRNGAVDSRILMMIPAYKSSVDADRSTQNNNSKRP